MSEIPSLSKLMQAGLPFVVTTSYDNYGSADDWYYYPVSDTDAYVEGPYTGNVQEIDVTDPLPEGYKVDWFEKEWILLPSVVHNCRCGIVELIKQGCSCGGI